MTDNSICDECGEKMDSPRDKNEAGHWRRACMPCIKALSPDERQ